MSIDLDNLPRGTEVKIVDEWRLDYPAGMQNSSGEMDKYLEKYLTIERTTYNNYYVLNGGGHWSWSPELFEMVKLPDSDIWYQVIFNPLTNKYSTEEINTNNIIEDKAKYYVFVSGKQTPKVLHNTLEAAETEAKRLSEREVGRLVSICKVEKQFISKIIVEEV